MIIDNFIGQSNEKKLKTLTNDLGQILNRQKEFKLLSDGDLLAHSLKLKAAIQEELALKAGISSEEKTEILDKYLVEAFALGKEVIKRVKGFELHDTQVMGGIPLHKGEAVQMATGEGKTLMAVLPTYLNALAGKGAHVFTPNSYLAQRDMELNSGIFSRLGLSCSFVPEEREANKEKIREAFASDITYVSLNEAGFNYLYDGLAYDAEDMLNDPQRYAYAIFDEADSILIDEAQVPLVISGISEKEKREDQEGAINKLFDNYLEESGKANIADDAIYQIYNLHHQLQARGKTNGLIYPAKDKLEYEKAIQTSFDGKANHKIKDNYALIYNMETKEVNLTDFGDRIISKFYIGREVNGLFQEDLNYMKTITDDFGNPKYRENRDYKIDSYGILKLTFPGYEKLIKDRDNPKINDLYDGREYSGNFNNDLQHLQNALTAYFSLSKDVDYVITEVKDGSSYDPRYNCYQVQLVDAGGRTAEGRVYSNGLQIAIEKKEQRFFKESQQLGKTVKIIETKEVPEQSSLSPTMFYKIYDKVAAMSGTIPQEAFEFLYQMETTEMPKNVDYVKQKLLGEGKKLSAPTVTVENKTYRKPSGITRKEDLFYFTNDKRTGEEAKLAKLMQEIQVSQAKGQPTLISTTSVDESVKIANEIKKQLGLEVPLLNANTKNEAEIISQAGKKGAITIATEMAGRGTDIKLGGEIDEESKARYRDISRHIAGLRFKEYQQTHPNLSKTELQTKFKTEALDNVFKESELIWEKERLEEKNKIILAGGLKLISIGHFRHERIDEQLMGRTGRQDDPGEVIFLSSEKELENLSLYQQDYAKLIQKAVSNRENVVYGAKYEKMIKNQQERYEEIAVSNVNQALKTETVIQKRRKDYRKQQDTLKNTENYQETIEFMLEQSVKFLIFENKTREIRSDTKFGPKVIDLPNLRKDLKDYLGIDFPVQLKNQESKYASNYLSALAINKHRKDVAHLTKEQYNQRYSPIVMEEVAKIWTNFSDSIETEKRQDYLNALTQYDKAVDIDVRIQTNYSKIVQESKINLASRVLTGRQRSYFEEKESKKEREFLSSQRQEDQRQVASVVTNFKPGSRLPVIAAEANTLNQTSTPLEFAREKVETIDFGHSSK